MTRKPGQVDETWRAYFDNLQSLPASDGNPETRDVAHAPIVQSFGPFGEVLPDTPYPSALKWQPQALSDADGCINS